MCLKIKFGLNKTFQKYCHIMYMCTSGVISENGFSAMLLLNCLLRSFLELKDGDSQQHSAIMLQSVS